MKKLWIVLLGAFAVACGNTDNTADEADRNAATTDESVEIGSGEEVSPQLEMAYSARLDVDTVSTTTGNGQ